MTRRALFARPWVVVVAGAQGMGRAWRILLATS